MDAIDSQRQSITQDLWHRSVRNLEQQCVMPWDLHHVIRLQVCIGRHRPGILEPPLLPEVHGMRDCGPRRFIIREWVPAEADDATSVFRRVRP